MKLFLSVFKGYLLARKALILLPACGFEFFTIYLVGTISLNSTKPQLSLPARVLAPSLKTSLKRECLCIILNVAFTCQNS